LVLEIIDITKTVNMNIKMKEKLKDLLTTVYQSVVSFDESQWIKPEKVSSFKYFHPHESECTLEGNITLYDFEISKTDMQYKFYIKVCKKEETSFWSKDRSKYVTRIGIVKDFRTSYSSREIDTFWFLSWVDDSLNIQKDIFNFLEKRNIELSEKEILGKYETYIGQLKKTVSKAASRDVKIDNLLEDK